MVIAIGIFDNYRPYFYLMIFGMSQVYLAYKAYCKQALEAQEF